MATGNIPKQARKVHIDGEEYHYQIGKEYIPIWMPSGEKYLGNWSEITGMPWHELEKYKYNGRYQVTITPADIKSFIKKKDLHRKE